MSTEQLQKLFDLGALPMAHIFPTYKPGEKLVHNVMIVSAKLGVACAKLENFYMDNFKKPVSEQVSRIMVTVKPEIFQHDKVCEFPVNWDDLFS